MRCRHGSGSQRKRPGVNLWLYAALEVQVFVEGAMHNGTILLKVPGLQRADPHRSALGSAPLSGHDVVHAHGERHRYAIAASKTILNGPGPLPSGTS